jgi:hypothetical protein
MTPVWCRPARILHRPRRAVWIARVHRFDQSWPRQIEPFAGEHQPEQARITRRTRRTRGTTWQDVLRAHRFRRWHRAEIARSAGSRLRPVRSANSRRYRDDFSAQHPMPPLHAQRQPLQTVARGCAPHLRAWHHATRRGDTDALLSSAGLRSTHSCAVEACVPNRNRSLGSIVLPFRTVPSCQSVFC